jgi:hypothetical protein
MFLIISLMLSASAFAFEPADVSITSFSETHQNYSNIFSFVENKNVLHFRNNQHALEQFKNREENHNKGDHQCECCDDCHCLNCLDCVTSLSASEVMNDAVAPIAILRNNIPSLYLLNYVSPNPFPSKRPPKLSC